MKAAGNGAGQMEGQSASHHYAKLSADDHGDDINEDSDTHTSTPLFSPLSSTGQQQEQQQSVASILTSPHNANENEEEEEPDSYAGPIEPHLPNNNSSSSILSASANLINAVVGAGIIGMPYAIRCIGLPSGVLTILLCAIITEKALRLSIATSRHVHVLAYEALAQACFGRCGYLFITANMFITAYGAMISYLMIIRDTLPVLLLDITQDTATKNNDNDNARLQQNLVLIISTLLIIVPLSMQRNMSDLAKTSKISVLFDCILVVIIAIFCPVRYQQQQQQRLLLQQSTSSSYVHQQLQEEEGAGAGWTLLQLPTLLIKSDFFLPKTFFIGLGVVSFAFTCQHSAFIIASSLHDTSRHAWSLVTRNALIMSGALAIICGVMGFLGFGNYTRGNILNNFLEFVVQQQQQQEEAGDAQQKQQQERQQYSMIQVANIKIAANLGRGLLCSTMFLVYPLESFVARHVCTALFFSNHDHTKRSIIPTHQCDDVPILDKVNNNNNENSQEEEDDEEEKVGELAVANHNFVRYSITFVLYLMAIIPAILLSDVGGVLAVTGAIAGSCLSYIGPGAVYIAVHGEAFLALVGERWGFWRPPGVNTPLNRPSWTVDDALDEVVQNGHEQQQPQQVQDEEESNKFHFLDLLKRLPWYIFLMPLWTGIAQCGHCRMQLHYQRLCGKASTGRGVAKNGDDICQKKIGLQLSISLPQITTTTTTTTAATLHDNSQQEIASSRPCISNQVTKHKVSVSNRQEPSHDGNPIISTYVDEDEDQDTIDMVESYRDIANVKDFAISIFLIIFGWFALVAGLLSIFVNATDR